MPTTRHAKVSDPGHAPERNLSSTRIRPITVSLAIASQACRAYPPRARAAALWLTNVAANSQRIQLCWQKRNLPDPLGSVGRITEADLAAKLGLEPLDIYRALTGHEDADLDAFTTAVERFRETFEAAIPPMVKTEDTAVIAEAFAAASEDHCLAEVRGKWRHGKTEECERQWLKNLHRAVWIDTPSDNTERTFIIAMASALGIGVGGGVKPSQLRDRIRNALGIGLIDTVIYDEAHNLWPSDLRDTKPLRAEYVRELRDSRGVGAMLVTTEQFALAMELAKRHNTRWAPGQVSGRIRVFRTRDTHTDGEIRAIAKLHVGAIEPEALIALVAFAKAEEGYLGTMIEAAKRARRKAVAARGEGAIITAAEIAAATKLQQQDQRVIDLVKDATPLRRGRFKVAALTTGRRAA